MRFWRRGEPAPDRPSEPEPPAVHAVIAGARELLGDNPAVEAASENPEDPETLNALIACLHERAYGEGEDSLDGDDWETAVDLMADLLPAKLHAQGVSPTEIRGWSL